MASPRPEPQLTRQSSVADILSVGPLRRAIKKKLSAPLLSAAFSGSSSAHSHTKPFHLSRSASQRFGGMTTSCDDADGSEASNSTYSHNTSDGDSSSWRQSMGSDVGTDVFESLWESLKDEQLIVSDLEDASDDVLNLDKQNGDIDEQTTVLLRALANGFPSSSTSKVPPRRILDVGCGKGHWAVDAAHQWSSAGSRVIGIDSSSQMLNRWDMDGAELRNRVCWVQANFLQGLPFPDRSFDFVRMANLTLVVPKDKWNFLFAEGHRVLAPGGRLEVIDDEMYFPFLSGPSPSSPSIGSLKFPDSPPSSMATPRTSHRKVSRTLQPKISQFLQPGRAERTSMTKIEDHLASSPGSDLRTKNFEESQSDAATQIDLHDLAEHSQDDGVFEDAPEYDSELEELDEPASTVVLAQSPVAKPLIPSHDTPLATRRKDEHLFENACKYEATRLFHTEAIFTRMLIDKYNINPCSADTIAMELSEIFGADLVHEVGTFQLALPCQSDILQAHCSGMGMAHTMNGDRVTATRPLNRQATFPTAATGLPENFASNPNSKAAKILGVGIDTSASALGSPVKHSSSLRDNRPRYMLPEPPNSLVLLSGKLVPFCEQEALEASALKHSKFLLECQDELHAYVDETCRDTLGDRTVSREALEELLWEYSCNYRKRLNYPSKHVGFLDDPRSFQHDGIDRTSSHGNSKRESTGENKLATLEGFDHSAVRVVVRSFRVFCAIKPLPT